MPLNNKPLKILEVIRQGQIGGGESHLLDLVSHFDPQLVEAIVLSFTPGPMIDALKAKGIKTYIVETNRPFDLKIQKKIKSIIINENIQLIHVHGSRAASNVVFIAKQLHLPLIYTVHGWSFHQDQNKLIHKLRCLSEKFISNRCQQVICVSDNNKVSGEKEFGLKQAIVIENGINTDRFNPTLNFKDIRQELGFGKNDFIIGFIARLTRQKAPLDFIKSIILAHQEYPTIKALFIGEGDQEEEAKAFISSQKAESYIITTPFRQDIPDILNAINVFCLPSLWEGLSISLLEAMAMKKALVVTPTDGTRELITHNINGKIVPFENPKALAQCYKEYYQHPEQMIEFGDINYEMIKQRFDCKKVSKKVTEIYNKYILH